MGPQGRPSAAAGRRNRFPSAARGAAASQDSHRITTALAVATCALAPAYTIRWHLGPLPTTILEDAVLLTIAAFVAESFMQRTVPYWRTAVLAPAILFLMAGAISIVVAPDHRAALGLYRAYFIEPIAFGLVLINLITTPMRAFLLAGGLALGGLVAGIANAAVVANALRHHAYDVVNTPPVVIYNTANATALYLVPVIALAGAIAMHAGERRLRLASGAFAVVASGCVVLSFSRGGYLALAAVAVGLALTHRRRWLLLGGGVGIAGALMLIPALRNRVLTDLDPANGHNTLVGRFHLWSVALQMLQDHPIFGAGLSGFATVIGPYWNPTNIDRFTYPHNIVLNAWTETGLLGVAAFAWILVVGFRASWRGLRSASPAWKAIHLGVLLTLVAVVVHGLVDVPYWKNDLSLEFWAIMSLSLAPAALSPPRSPGDLRTPAQPARPSNQA
ncbi:MAG: O-antigen ligase family protein [Candidatus Dormibacteraceae bacterium]